MNLRHPHFFQILLGKVIAFFYRILVFTWTYEVKFHDGMESINFGENPSKPFFLSCWHRDDVSMLGFCINKKFMTLVSDSKDGTMLASALSSLGIGVKRGSSTRGGVKGLLGMLKESQKNPLYFTLAVDGPKGPIFKAKPGAYFLAKNTNSLCGHGIAQVKSYWTLHKAWMKTRIPKPFTKITIHFYPLPNPTTCTEDEFLTSINQITTY